MNENAARKAPTVTLTGTPDAPAFKRRPMLLIISLVLYAAFVALLIYWAVQLRRSKVSAVTSTVVSREVCPSSFI